MSNDDRMASWPTDPTATSYVPSIGEHVFCYRPSDGKTRCGFVDDNKMGLFLTSCHNGRVVLTAVRWNVQPVTPTNTCRTTASLADQAQGQTSPNKGDQVT